MRKRRIPMRKNYPCKQPRTKRIPLRVLKCLNRGIMRNIKPTNPHGFGLSRGFGTYSMPKLPATSKQTKREVIHLLLKYGREILSRPELFPLTTQRVNTLRTYFNPEWIDGKSVWVPTYRALRLLEQWGQ